MSGRVRRCVCAVAPALVLGPLGACTPSSGPPARFDRAGQHPLPAPIAADATRPSFGGRAEVVSHRVRLRRSTATEAVVRVEARLLVTGPLVGRSLGLEVRLAGGAGARGGVGVGRAGLGAIPPPVLWQVGDVVDVDVDVPVDVTALLANAPPGEVEAKVSWALTDRGQPLRRVDAGQDDTRDWVADDAVTLTNAAPAETAAGGPRLEVPEASAAIVVDGVLNEAAWQTAAITSLRPSITPTGTPPTPLATTVRLLWRPEGLLVGWEIEDDDPHSPYDRDDDPLYESEAYELFLDVDPDDDARTYVEVQSNFRDVHFDASFRGGPRRGMNTAWQSGLRSQTTRVDDQHLVAEWLVPWPALADGTPFVPRVGYTLRANLFRLEHRREGRKRVEASAWSPPERPDFHATERFGTLVLAPARP